MSQNVCYFWKKTQSSEVTKWFCNLCNKSSAHLLYEEKFPHSSKKFRTHEEKVPHKKFRTYEKVLHLAILHDFYLGGFYSMS